VSACEHESIKATPTGNDGQAISLKSRTEIARSKLVTRNIPTIIIASQTLLREGLAALLEGTNFRVIKSISSPDQAAHACKRSCVTIIGSAAEGPEDLVFVQTVSHATPRPKIVVVIQASGPSADHDFSQWLRSGADALILNVHSRTALLKTMELTLLEQKLVLVDLAGTVERADDQTPPVSRGQSPGNVTANTGLSKRELEILSCLAAGFSNKLVARWSRISEATVKIHLRSILRKLKVQNRTQAAIWAFHHGLKRMSEAPVGIDRLPRRRVPRRGI
jgi:two-component system, NarL family, nitrate/nitrite response regulator NarL